MGLRVIAIAAGILVARLALRSQPRDDASKNQSKRLRARWDQIKESWRGVAVSEEP